MGQLLAPSFTSSQQTQQALSHNVTMPARDKLLDEKQLAGAQGRQDGNDASRKKKKKKKSHSGILAFSKTVLVLSSPLRGERNANGLGLHLRLSPSQANCSHSCFSISVCEFWEGTVLH